MSIKIEQNKSKMIKKKYSRALKTFKSQTLEEVILLENTLIHKENENQRLRSALQLARDAIVQQNETIYNQARLIEIQTHFDPDALIDSQRALQYERKYSAMALKLLKESRVAELITRTKLNNLLEEVNKMQCTDYSSDSSADTTSPSAVN